MLPKKSAFTSIATRRRGLYNHRSGEKTMRKLTLALAAGTLAFAVSGVFAQTTQTNPGATDKAGRAPHALEPRPVRRTRDSALQIHRRPDRAPARRPPAQARLPALTRPAAVRPPLRMPHPKAGAPVARREPKKVDRGWERRAKAPLLRQTREKRAHSAPFLHSDSGDLALAA